MANKRLKMGLSDFMGIRNVVEVDPKPWMEEKKFTLVTSIEQLTSVIDRAIEAEKCALDLETTGLDNRIKPNGKTVDNIVGYCLSFDGEEGFYVPVQHVGKDGKYNVCLDDAAVVEEIKRLVENCVLIFHNAAFDCEFLYGKGIEVDSYKQFEDTMLLDYLRDSNARSHGLKTLSENFLGLEMIKLSELFTEDTRDYDFSTLDPNWDPVLLYAGSDAIITYQLYQFYRTHAYRPHRNDEGRTEFRVVPESDLDKTIFGSQPFIYYIEKICVPALRWMERNRIKVDLPYLNRLLREVELLMEQVTTTIAEGFQKHGYVGFTKNDVSSAQKIGAALEYLQHEGLIRGKLVRTETSEQVKTDDTTMMKLVEKHKTTLPFLNQIPVFRSLQKVAGTYIRPLILNCDTDGQLQDQTIRFSNIQHGTFTGRFSARKGKVDQGYSGINVQSIPACYNIGKFSAKKITERPSGSGEVDVKLYESFTEAVENDFLVRVYDGHFVQDVLEEQEYCVRESCEGCPFAEECNYTDEPEWSDEADYYENNVSFPSLDAAVRPAFTAREGYVISPIDQSGVELRVAANITKEEKWVEEFTEGTGDLHTLTTKIVFGDDVVNKPDFKEYRQKGKAANFAILYGGSGNAVARGTGVSREEGEYIKRRWLEGLPALNQWFKRVKRQVKRDKQVTTAFGRKIRLPDIDHEEGWIRSKAERNAINSIIQGSATGDLTKYCMGRVYQELKRLGELDNCRMILTIHDELVFEMRKDKLDTLVPVIEECMTELGVKAKWPVPLEVDVELGINFYAKWDWGKMHTIDPDTGIAKQPVPKELLGRIELYDGMWHYDENGDRVIIEVEKDDEAAHEDDDPAPPEERPEPTDKPEDPLEGKETSPSGDGDDEALTEDVVKASDEFNAEYRQAYTRMKDVRNGKLKAKQNAPVFVYRLRKSPPIINGDDNSEVADLVRKIYQIIDYFAVEVDLGHHLLRVEDFECNKIISEDDNILVEPNLFVHLARFLGVSGFRAAR